MKKKKLSNVKSKPAPIALKKKEPPKNKLSEEETPGRGETSALVPNNPTQKRLSSWPWKWYRESLLENVDSLRLYLVNIYKDHPASSYGYYDEASASAKAAQAKLPPFNVDDVPLPLDEIPASNDPEEQEDAEIKVMELKRDYFAECGDWLRGCRKNILSAVDAGDEKFFVRLAALIQKRPTIRDKSLMGRRSVRRSDFLPKVRTDFWRHMMANHWVDSPLWLMSDAVGCAYLNKFTGEKMTEANYKKIRQKLGLFQHPERPVNNFTAQAMPQIRLGWKFPES